MKLKRSEDGNGDYPTSVGLILVLGMFAAASFVCLVLGFLFQWPESTMLSFVVHAVVWLNYLIIVTLYTIYVWAGFKGAGAIFVGLALYPVLLPSLSTLVLMMVRIRNVGFLNDLLWFSRTAGIVVATAGVIALVVMSSQPKRKIVDA